jgi:hypothetical protein
MNADVSTYSKSLLLKAPLLTGVQKEATIELDIPGGRQAKNAPGFGLSSGEIWGRLFSQRKFRASKRSRSSIGHPRLDALLLVKYQLLLFLLLRLRMLRFLLLLLLRLLMMMLLLLIPQYLLLVLHGKDSLWAAIYSTH